VPDFPPIRRLGPDDLKSCATLSADRGWLPEKRKWGLLLEAAEVFGIDAPDGGLAGSVTLARYGEDHASVGMMLVAARYGRQGLGRRLLTHLLDAAGGATVTLFATDMGRPLYERLGFKPVGRSVSFTGTFRAAPEDAAPQDAAPATRPAGTTRPAGDADLPSILRIDQAAFGADRSRFIRQLPSFAERILLSGVPADPDPGPGTGPGQGITGYAAAWSNGGTTVIGPVIAPDSASARRLITDLARGARGQVRLDLDPDRPELPAWAQARGLSPRSLNVVMAHGPWDPPGDRARIYAPISVALT
jgi:GNAT superfamily N-acetyltransferase